MTTRTATPPAPATLTGRLARALVRRLTRVRFLVHACLAASFLPLALNGGTRLAAAAVALNAVAALMTALAPDR